MQDGPERGKIGPVRKLPAKLSRGKISIVRISLLALRMDITRVARDVLKEKFTDLGD